MGIILFQLYVLQLPDMADVRTVKCNNLAPKPIDKNYK